MTDKTTEELLKDAEEYVAFEKNKKKLGQLHETDGWYYQPSQESYLIAELAAKLKDRAEAFDRQEDILDDLQDWLGEDEIKIEILQVQYEHLTDKELDKHEWKAQHKEWHKQADSFEGLQLTPPKKENNNA